MSLLSPRQKLHIDFQSLRSAAPKGVYVAPLPDHPLIWRGVLFVRKGPYANAVLRFQIAFPDDYPRRPPVVTFQSDLFHPLVTPLTTYTYSTRDFGADTVSAADEQRLPPGGLSLRHGFPEWFQATAGSRGVRRDAEALIVSQSESKEQNSQTGHEVEAKMTPQQPPHVVELLQYVRIVFDTEEVLDSIPLEAAANTGAWHAWMSFRSKASAGRITAPIARSLGSSREASNERSSSPRQQPGGARRPGEWNWQGVWEDRVRKSVQTSVSEPVLFGGDNNDVINFFKAEQETLQQISPLRELQAST